MNFEFIVFIKKENTKKLQISTKFINNEITDIKNQTSDKFYWLVNFKYFEKGFPSVSLHIFLTKSIHFREKIFS